MIKILFYFLKQGREIHFMHLIKIRSQVPIPKYLNPAGDHLKGNGDIVLGISIKLPRGMASDLVKLILYPENKLNRVIILMRGGIDDSGEDKNNKTSSA